MARGKEVGQNDKGGGGGGGGGGSKDVEVPKTMVLVSGIPESMHSSDLRSFFSDWVEGSR